MQSQVQNQCIHAQSLSKQFKDDKHGKFDFCVFVYEEKTILKMGFVIIFTLLYKNTMNQIQFTENKK